MATDGSNNRRRREVLTPSERLRYERDGFVVLADVLAPSLVERLRDAMLRCHRDDNRGARGVYIERKGRTYYSRVGNLLEYDAAVVELATHPTLVALAEDAVGGAVRLEENESVMNRRDPELDVEKARATRPNAYNPHRAMDPSWGMFTEGGRMHSLLVKAIVYLSDVGPDDGGTCFIAGSHRLAWPRREIIDAANQDRSLYRCVEGPRGTTIFFTEACLHSTSLILTDNTRVMINSGYAAPMLRMERGHRVRPEFAATLPEEVRPVLTGSARWNWKRHYE